MDLRENVATCFKEHNEMTSEIKKIRHALEESVKLQSHYAKLLNLYDGGERMLFESGSDWINRLEEIGAFQPEDSADCNHEWVSAKNAVIESGEYCPKCHAIRG